MKERFFIVSVVIILGATLILWVQGSSPQGDITPRAAYERSLTDSMVVLLDVRTPSEYTGELGHAPQALLIPLQELNDRLEELEPYRGKTIIAICRTGNRSGKAASLLSGCGFAAVNMEGGMKRWIAEGLPVSRDSATALPHGAQ